MPKPTFGSLFAGIGGLDLGLERAGWQCKWQVEIDEYARRVLAKHWPNVNRYSDVRTVGTELERVDLVCGGFPCQDVSLAKHDAGGIDGSRSGLWFEFARVLGILRPRIALVENVPGLFVRGIDRVLGGLAALGFDAEWSIVSACAMGAPHTRERLFILGYSQEISPWRDQRQRPSGGGCRCLETDLANRGHTGPPNPTWQEWLMGFPLGWTDLEPSATP